MKERSHPEGEGRDSTRAASTLEVRRRTDVTHVEDTWPPLTADHIRWDVDDFPEISSDPYERGREVARGGLGRIIEGIDRRLGRRVALKVLISRDAKAQARFIREAKITARLEHPNIVPIHEAGRWPDGERFYAMKLVEGRTLSEALAQADSREKRLELLPHLIDVADAVGYAHSQGILHRDLKPANVMVGPFGETLLIDWGLAKDLGDPYEPPTPDFRQSPSSRESSETSDGIVVGTPPYMAPEQARADPLDERSDVYALGAMLYQVLCGHRPYEDVAPNQVLLAVVRGPPAAIESLAPDMPRDLVAIVKKAMHRNPAHRYPSAQEMANELRRFTTGQLVAAHRYSLLERTLRFVRRNAATFSVAVLLLVVLASFAAWSFQRLARRTEAAETAQRDAEQRVRELSLEKARSLLGRDPTAAAAWLKRIRPPVRGTASAAAEAEDRGVALAVLEGHVQEVELVRFHPNGRSVASGSRDGTVRIWSPSGAPLRELHHGARISALGYSPDGQTLASGAYDGAVRLYSREDVRPRVLRRHEAPVVALRFSPRGDRLLTLGRDGRLVLWSRSGRRMGSFATPPVGDWAAIHFLDEGRVVTGGHGRKAVLWDLEAGTQRNLAELGEDITAIAAHKGQVALGTVDGTVALVDPARRAFRTMGGHDTEVRALAFSPDALSLASASLAGRVLAFSLGSSRGPERFEEHEERVTQLRYSPGGRWLASASWDGTVRLRDLDSKQTQTLRGHGQVITDIAFSPDGARLVSASWDTHLRLWPVEATGGVVLRGHRIGVHAVAFNPDGRLLASGGHDDELRLWDLRTGTGRVLAGHGDTVYRVVFSPDGRWLASSSDDRTVRLWSVRTGKARVLEGHRGDVEELVFSRDGRWLASAGRLGDLYVWSVPDGQGRSLVAHRQAVTGLGFVDGGQLATSSLDGQLLLWRVSDRAPPTPLFSGAGPLRGLDVTRDGRRLAVTGGDSQLFVWALPERRLVHEVRGLVEPETVRLSPNGTYAAVASAQRGLWLCSLAYELCDSLAGHEARVFALDFSLSGRALVTGSGDHSVRLWDVETLESRVLRGHRAPVFDVAFSPNGRFLASGSGDTDVRVWPAVLPPAPHRIGAFLDALTQHQIDAAAAVETSP